MSVLINADTSDGLKFTSDTSGEIKLQSAGADIATVSSTGITMAAGKTLPAAALTGTVPSSSVDALSTASGSAPSYSARAWVNFNGTGTVAIRASGNVSSITDLGVGLYRLNFSSSLPDVNYSVIGNHLFDTVANNGQMLIGIDLQTSYCGVKAAYVISTGGATASTDAPYVWAAIFR